MRVACAFLSIIFLSLAVQGQTPASRAEGHLDIVVRDSRGRIVRDLETADFVVAEDGVELPVREVRFIDSSKNPAGPHLISLLFEGMQGEPAESSREAALALLAAARPRDVFAVFEIDQKLGLLQTFTADRKALKEAIDRATRKRRQARNAPPPAGRPSSDGPLGETAQQILRAAERITRGRDVRPSVASLLALARGQGGVHGRKAVVYFSPGLAIADRNDETLRTILSVAQQSGVSIYAVDASGLATSREEERARDAAVQNASTLVRQTSSNFDETSGRVPKGAYGDGRRTLDGILRPAAAPPSGLALLASGSGGFVIAQGESVRSIMRRIPEELGAYYEATYRPRDMTANGGFRSLRVSVKRDKLKIQGRDGYFAVPDLPGPPARPYELPLLDALGRPPAQDFPSEARVFRFRSEAGDRPLVSVAMEVLAKHVQFTEDSSSGQFLARVAALGLVRDRDGVIVERFGRDASVQAPPRMLDAMRERRFLFQDHFELPPGNYTLETAVRDQQAGRFSTRKSDFTVAPVTQDFAMSSLSIARQVTPAEQGSKPDGAFRLEGKVVVPALDGIVRGGQASLYVRVYPSAGAAAPVELECEILKGGKSVLRSPLQLLSPFRRPRAQVFLLDVSKLPPGPYDARLTATQADRRTTEQARIVIEPGAPAQQQATDDAEQPEVAEARAELPSRPLNAGQRRLLDQARDVGVQYTGRLPNFICTQVTRQMLDPKGAGQWRVLGESAQLVSFYDGQEHYHELAARTRVREGNAVPPSLASTGEFGSLLKAIFGPESQATFGWVRADSVRGRTVLVFTYSVDVAHSKYRISYNHSQTKPAVITGYRGLVFIDDQTAAVLRITHEVRELLNDMPMRKVELTVDYDDIAVGGHIYLLPVSASVDVRLRKATIVRNEVSFRSYQRFTTDSRFVSLGVSQKAQ